MSEPHSPGSGSAWDELQRDAAAMAAVTQRLFPGGQAPDVNVPADPSRASVVIDTDIGGDPDDALAVVAAARGCPQLALVVTTDETQAVPARRAGFARWLLDELGRRDVVVVAGASLGEPRYYCVDGLAPDPDEAPPNDVVAAVASVCATADGPIRWVGQGPMTNLATVIQQAPELAPRIHLTQMAGTLSYPDPNSAEHNIKLDIPAAQTVLSAVSAGLLPTPRFISTDVTFNAEIAVSTHSDLYQCLAAAEAPAWAGALTQHLDRWFAGFHRQTYMHDPLALSAALALPFVHATLIRVFIDDAGLVHPRDDGAPSRWSTKANHSAFMAWLRHLVDPAQSPAIGPRTHDR